MTAALANLLGDPEPEPPTNLLLNSWPDTVWNSKWSLFQAAMFWILRLSPGWHCGPYRMSPTSTGLWASITRSHLTTLFQTNQVPRASIYESFFIKSNCTQEVYMLKEDELLREKRREKGLIILVRGPVRTFTFIRRRYSGPGAQFRWFPAAWFGEVI